MLVGRETDKAVVSKVLFLMLGLPTLSPKVQVFLVCSPQGCSRGSTDTELFSPAIPDLPFELRFRTRPSLLSCPSRCGFRTLHHVTSDDVALLLVQTKLKQRSARHTQPSMKNCGNLLELVLSGFVGEAFSLAPRSSRRQKTSATKDDFVGALSCLALQNPLDQGRAAAAREREHRKSGGGEGNSASAPAAEVPKPNFLDDFAIVDAFPAVICESLVDLVLDASKVDEGGEISDAESEEAEPKVEVPPDVEADELASLAIDTEEPAAPSSSASSLPSYDLEDYVIGDGGRVTHKMHPNMPIGTIKFFGQKGQNISCVCGRHTKCRILRSTRNFGQNRMLSWLIRGTVLPGTCTLAESTAAGVEHMKLFGVVKP